MIESIKKLDLESKMQNSKFYYEEPMSKHTSFRIGGPADLFIEVGTFDDLETLLKIDDIHNAGIPITVVGNGTNLLVKDGGISGIVIKYANREYLINDTEVTACAGISNGVLSQVLLNAELTGFEFAAGIPGTLGGAVFMNAGAYDHEMKEIVKEVNYIDLDTMEIKTIGIEDLKYGYRQSIFQDEIHGIILSANLSFKKDKKENIRARMDEYMQKRVSTQPLDMPSAGSIFKRQENFITAKAIDEAGLKGYSIGGAQISTKHAGFIVNCSNATAQDVIDLIQFTQRRIQEETGRNIETEVRIIGR